MTTNNETDIMTVAVERANDNGISMAAVIITPSVNNPYTFSITKNIAFSAICEEDWSGGGK